MKNLILINLMFFSAFIQSSEANRPQDAWAYHGPIQVAKVMHREGDVFAVIIPENLLPGEPFMVEGMGERIFRSTNVSMPAGFAEQLPSAVREQTDLKK